MTDDEQVDEAIETICDAAREDEETPLEESPWAPVRGPLYVIAGACFTLCVSVLLLVVMVLRNDNLSEEETARNKCVQRFQVQSEEAASEARSQTSILIATVGRELLVEENNGDRALEALRPELEALQVANERDREAVAAREAWTEAGQPLPCPIED